jgi:aerobic carbon-monoxide dehydrogenase medium subunit
MYPASFQYHAPATLQEALALLDRHQGDAKVLAGSQSLIPLMKLRLAQPAHLVDLRKLPGLVGISESGDALQIGAMTTHRAIEASELLRTRLPVLPEAASLIGDTQVRNLGTIGGSLAHADPSADWPAVAIALDASVLIASKRGERTMKAEELITGPLTTALEPSEILVQVRVPFPPPRAGSTYEKVPHPASRFAVVGVAAAVTLDDRGTVRSARVAVTGLAPKIARARATEQALIGKSPNETAIDAAAASAAEGIQIRGDLSGSAAYKAHLLSVTAGRALRRAVARVPSRS